MTAIGPGQGDIYPARQIGPSAGSPPWAATPAPYPQFAPGYLPPAPSTAAAIKLGGDDVAGDLRAAGAVGGVLAVLGVLAGLVWGLASPHSLGYVARPGVVIPNETEQFIGADGRFVLITAIIGLVAGAVCWAWRARRGPVLAVGLAGGGVVGAVLTALVGHLVAGGHGSGAVNSRLTLPITLHAGGLVALEAGLALLVYLAGTLISGPDDLGRSGTEAGAGLVVAGVVPDPERSVGAGGNH